jgi:hypothetical protein
MISVTARINTVSQPVGGYVNPKLLKVKGFYDENQINEILPAYKAIQGMAVDYLTRFMTGCSKTEAFEISLLGAEIVNELDNAKRLLNSINGLDKQSVYSACQLVGYDVAFRRGAIKFRSVEKINPDESVIENISIMVKRSLEFLKKHGPVVMDGFKFEGGYTKLVSSGDGDYITRDTLWDFKVSQREPTIMHTLQLLMYYILGFHSIHNEFLSIKKIGIYNPLLNTAYELELSRISDEVFKAVSHDVLGYKVPDKAKDWRLASGNDEKILLEFLRKNFKKTSFNPDKYDDGIYDISLDDYWTYYRDISGSERPKFNYTKSVKFLKNADFIMFISVTEKGTMSILHGGRLHRINRPLPYYYDKMPEYSNLVLQKFSKYWDALYSIAKHIQTIAPDKTMVKKKDYADHVRFCKSLGMKHEDFETYYEKHKDFIRFSGKVHGCIVDLDYSNHIYLNPHDGTATSYTASSMYEKFAYKNLASLIAKQRPEMLPGFKKSIAENSTALVVASSDEKHSLVALNDDEIDMYDVPVYDTSMYDVSNRLKALQQIYDYHLIIVWHDNVLPHYELEGERDNTRGSLLGQSEIMNCGMTATVIKDNGYKDITVQFEDRTIVEHIARYKFKHRTISNPNISMEHKPKRKIKRLNNTQSYEGRTAVMNCGFKATVIEDFGCNDITIQFEDGLVRKHCRRDRFREGKIAHKE